jgi:hypothetical protein
MTIMSGGARPLIAASRGAVRSGVHCVAEVRQPPRLYGAAVSRLVVTEAPGGVGEDEVIQQGKLS